MKILFYKWNTYGQEDLEQSFLSLGHQVDTLYYVMKSFECEPTFEALLRTKLQEHSYDFVFSLNYFPIISNLCSEYHLLYLSWTIDSPLLQLYSTSVRNACNYIFSFDSKTTVDIRNLGAKHIYNLPLAVSETHYGNLTISEEDRQNYQHAVTFVGSTYQGKSFLDKATNLPAHLLGYLDGIITAQKHVSGYNFLEELLPPSVMEELSRYIYLGLGKEFIGTPAMVFANSFLGTKVTEKERLDLLGSIAEHYPLSLYTKNDTAATLPLVQNCGTVDYQSEMPKVFHCSKINLNITLRNIQHGIPLRVFDVLASGGFLLTNMQPDLSPHFIDGEDLVVYYDKDDLLQKIGYYLSHDEERKAIAANGHKKVMEVHTHTKRIQTMLSTVFNSNL